MKIYEILETLNALDRNMEVYVGYDSGIGEVKYLSTDSTDDDGNPILLIEGEN
jgi:hypothetical protein